MLIELLQCKGCWRIHDQTVGGPGCSSCRNKISSLVGPTLFNLLKWFFSGPVRVSKLVVHDLLGK